ncbi:MAG: bifunctional DNA primase/polymerase [Rhizomicrobium sp.]
MLRRGRSFLHEEGHQKGRPRGHRMTEARGNSMSYEQMLEAALVYRKQGWSAIPIQPRKKLPLIAWEEFQHRLASADEITTWFQRWPDANVGIVTGMISGIAVLDIDARHGGVESLERLEAEHGKLPATAEAETGGGGRHYYFAASLPLLRNRAGLFSGIDLRAEGGMVVAPPSVHPSGKRYRWLMGCSPATVSLAALPQWLQDAALGGHEMAGHPASYWRKLIQEGVKEGARNTTIASLAGHLLWRGIDPNVATELLLCWNRVRCRPPLSDDEVARVSASIARLHVTNEQNKRQ